MKLYLSVIGVSMAIISALNITLGTAPWYTVIFTVIWSTALQFAFDGLIALTVNRLPDRAFGVENALFYVSKREIKLYKNCRHEIHNDTCKDEMFNDILAFIK